MIKAPAFNNLKISQVKRKKPMILICNMKMIISRMRKLMTKMMEMGAIQERIPRMMEKRKEIMSEADYSFQKFNKEQ